MSGGIEFDWEAENTKHLKKHRVTPKEFEELMVGEPVYLEYQVPDDEERYKVLGLTAAGRILIGIWAREWAESAPSRPTLPTVLTEIPTGRPVDETETCDTRFQITGRRG